jgi:hypothetical protein
MLTRIIPSLLLAVTGLVAGCSVETTGQESPSASIHQSIEFPAECTDPIPGTCGFYTQCLEPKFSCGPDGYPVGYGDKYCNKFSSEHRFSEKGNAWRLTTLGCLQRALTGFMSPDTVANGSSCSTIEQIAFDSHPACYTQSVASLCDLNILDWRIVFSVIDVKDMVGQKALKQMVEVGKTCAAGIVRDMFPSELTPPWPTTNAIATFRPATEKATLSRIFAKNATVESVRTQLEKLVPNIDEAAR